MITIVQITYIPLIVLSLPTTEVPHAIAEVRSAINAWYYSNG